MRPTQNLAGASCLSIGACFDRLGGAVPHANSVSKMKLLPPPALSCTVIVPPINSASRLMEAAR